MVPRQRAVLVTGASSGFGLQIARRLADSGFFVYAGVRTPLDVERLDLEGKIKAVLLDVTRNSQIQSAHHEVEKEGRGLWGIVNNAGVYNKASLVRGTIQAIEHTFDVNVFGAMRVNAAFIGMIEDSGGRTTCIGSVDGIRASGSDGGYSASKAALSAYADSLAAEYSDSEVHVSIIESGEFRSEIRRKILQQIMTALSAGEISMSDSERRELIRTELGNRKLDEPRKVADAVLHVMTSKAPRRRYMIVPNERRASRTIEAALHRVVELNFGHEYSYQFDELATLLYEQYNDG